MTPYDAAMAGVVVAGMVWGAWRGITWQLASIASLVLGYTLAHPLSSQLAPYFPGEPVVARALAMLTVYFAASAGVFFAAWVVRASLRRLKFEAFDRHLGMILGGLEGALLGMVATLFVVSLAPQSRDPIFGSPTGKVVGRIMASLGPVVPEEARGVLAPFLTDQEPGAVADREPIAPEPETQSALRRGTSGGTRDGETTPASLTELIEAGEARAARAIADGAARGVRQAVGGGADDGTAQRR